MMLRTAYCCNLNPIFVAPEHHNPRPPYSQRLGELIKKSGIALWDGFWALPIVNPKTLEVQPPRQRRFNHYRAKAMQAVAQAIVHHMNITTGVVCCSVEKISELCGLVTVSKAGNRSITRASRIICLFEAYGLLRCEREWDATLGIWFPKIMTVTPLFIQMVGSNEQEWQAAIRQQQAYQRSGLLKTNEVQLTPEEAAVRMKARMKELYLKNRQERHERKRAIKLLRQSYEEQRHEISQKLIKKMSLQELTLLGLDGFTKLVNQKLSTLRKLVGYSPTD